MNLPAVTRLPLYALAVIALLLLGVVASPVLLDTFAPPPEVFQTLPVAIAENPQDPARWDFSSPHPMLHAGDPLVGEFDVCYSDIFGGPTVRVESQRSLVSSDGKTRAVLQSASLIFPVGCHVTHNIIDSLPASLPPGSYHLEGTSVAIDAHYYHAVSWRSVEFSVVP